MNASFSLRASSPDLTSRVFFSFSPASDSKISLTSSRSFSGSSSSTSSTSTSSPSIFTTAALPPLPAGAADVAGATGAGGATKSNSARFRTRLGVPRPALRIFSINFGTDISSSRASTTNS